MNATDLLDAFERLDEQTTMPLSHAEVIRLAVDSAHFRSHGRQDPTPGQTRGTALSPGGPADHRPDGGARARPERDRRPRRRKLPRPAAERRVPGSHRIGQIASIVRVGEIRVQRTVPRHIRAHARPRRTGDGRGRQTGRACPSSCANTPTYNLLAIDEWLVDKPDEPFKRSCSSSWNSGTTRPAPRSPPNWRPRTWHRQLGGDTIADAILDPHRAQHDLDQYRRIQHETTPRTNHARQLTQKAGGPQPVRHRPPRTITPASKHNKPVASKATNIHLVAADIFYQE